ncbi:translocator protein, LysE family [Bacteriovorax sp. BSW11_IV]|uniref:LysE family translocator n=1 Tax=Bacteriovorax sp. BSW11_IV TaxID=1353529 RepID=UPI000389DB5C|nr:LysE family translocator [Bacteriovorax sp. BSW11_IV]EQC42945.1 translocator protein, LysE family [Bacteriovorax sp. BSW11_IV]
MSLASLVVIMFFAQLSPGPDMALLLRNILTYGRKASLLTVLGIVVGLSCHFTFASFGLALIIKSSPFIFSLIKALGSLYLIYIGVMGLISKGSGEQTEEDSLRILSSRDAFTQGFLCNLLNPKATLFIFSLYTGLITHGVKTSVLLGHSAVLLFEAFVVWSLFVYIVTTERIIKKLKKIETIISKVLCIILLGLGIFSLLSLI